MPQTEKLSPGFSGRLKQVRNTLSKSQREMDSLLGLGKKSWQQYESGGIAPGGRVFTALAQQGVNMNWLLGGDGPMLLDGGDGASHADYVAGRFGGDKAAAQRYNESLDTEAKKAATLSKRQEIEITLQHCIERRGYSPPPVLVYALEQSVYNGDLTWQGADELLRALEQAYSGEKI